MGRLKSDKYIDSVSLYNSGLSIQDCAYYYGITRQAMHKILKRRGCEFRPNVLFADDNHFFRGVKRCTDKIKRVHDITERALKRGIISNPGKCSCCGNSYRFKDGRIGIQAHHDDYDKPLDVRWLCQSCHHEWHKYNVALNTI